MDVIRSQIRSDEILRLAEAKEASKDSKLVGNKICQKQSNQPSQPPRLKLIARITNMVRHISSDQKKYLEV